MKYPKLRELKEAVTALIKGPCTVKFPKEPSPAPRAYRGKPVYDEKECVGCTACTQVCPVPDLYFEDRVENGKGTRRLRVRYDECIFCKQCEAYCITGKGIVLTNEYDMSATSRKELEQTIEKELVLCELCGGVIGALDHIRWVAKKIGPAAFSNPTLMLSLLRDPLSLGKEAPELSSPVRRSDRIRILCPKCRRETTIENI